jgi:exopolyphosphatase/guanosine-5'-triphosphate,3'-diphosphate pyrophosphatase
MQRTLTALRGFVARIQATGCERVVGVGTEAIRKADYGAELVRAFNELLAPVGGDFQTIDGEREARLSWRAVRAAFPQLHGVRTVLDIGGGSTELLVGDATPEQVISVPIGSVRLTERLLKHDPPTAAEKQALRETVDRALDGAPTPRGTLVGIAGTVTTLAAMAQALTTYDAERVHGSQLGHAQLQATVERLGDTPVADRKRTPGLDPRRADVIYAGAVILERVLARAGASSCLVSDRGIRWGLAYEVVGLG